MSYNSDRQLNKALKMTKMAILCREDGLALVGMLITGGGYVSEP